MEYHEIEKLIDELSQASQSYYQDKTESLLTDEEYDSKIEFLESFVDTYPKLFDKGSKGFSLLDGDVSQGSTLVAKNTVNHSNPMLSLAKAKTEEELYAWIRRVEKFGAKDFRLQAKLDGFAISAIYENGTLVRLATRGDGLVGEDQSYLINHKEVSIVGLPMSLESNDTFEVRGELFLTDDQFKKLDQTRFDATGLERFKNSRNGMVGTIKKAELGLGYKAEVTFGAYSYYKDNILSNLEELEEEFLTVDKITQNQDKKLKLTGFSSNKELFDGIKKFGASRESFTIPTDGVVIKPTNESDLHSKMGNTSHHPASQIAFKYPGATAISTINAIDLTVGKTGKVTPIGRVTPVDLEGTTISNISLHNFNWLYSKDLRVGSVVSIHRANGVIPQVKAVITTPEESTKVDIPKNCPSCSSELKTLKNEDIWPPRTLRCENTNCPSKDFFALKNAVSKNNLNIDGLSIVSLEYLNSIGRVTTIDDLYTLTLDELANSQLGLSIQGNPRRLGESRAKNILEHIEKSKTLPLYKLLASLSINGLGPQIAKELVNRFKTLEALQKASIEDISIIEGFGEIRALSIYEGLNTRATLIEKLKKHGVQFDKEETTVESDSGLNGLSFSISGTVPECFANRNELVDYIEASGGVFHSAPKSNTNYMIGDENDSSSKIQKAKKLGLTFILPENFEKTFVK